MIGEKRLERIEWAICQKEILIRQLSVICSKLINAATPYVPEESRTDYGNEIRNAFNDFFEDLNWKKL